MTSRTAILMLLAASATAAAPAAAQQMVWTRAERPAWLGVSYDVHWMAGEGTCEPRVVVEAVVPGAPADRAGLQPGDAIVALDGEPIAAARLQRVASRLSAGDSVRLRVSRGGRVLQVLAVADYRPDRPPRVLRLDGGGLEASDLPVVRLIGDTLMARNLHATGFRPARGYWVAYDDGRAEYRRIRRFPDDGMDRRVLELLRCAATNQAAAPAAAPVPPGRVRVDLHALQVRADSLREVIARRALSREDVEAVIRMRGEPIVDVASAPEVDGPRREVSVFTFSDHVAAAERGVAGAEFVEMEPELAEYFRGVGDGLLVLRVAEGSPAARAGLRPGDVVTSAAGRPMHAVGQLRALLALPGEVALRVVRHGRTREITIPRD